MFLFPLDPNTLLAFFQIWLISLIVFLAFCLSVYRKPLPYCTDFFYYLYLFINPPPPPEQRVDHEFLLDWTSLIFHPHHPS